MNNPILKLSKCGLPRSWVSREEAATLYAKQQVVWSAGDACYRINGGINRRGHRSFFTLAPIIACEGENKAVFVPLLNNRLLFRRDGYRCMYCGFEFGYSDLTRDHVQPRSRRGRDCWTNVVAACKRCNHYKDNRTPEEAGMALLAVPFEPNLFEFMYLANRQILGDQMEYLKARFSGQRCWEAA